jgi:DNA-binding protein YbaB
MFDKLKQLNDLRKKSQEIEKDLSQEVIELTYHGIVVKISANLEIINLETAGKSDSEIMGAINKAIKEAQKIAAQKMRGQLGALGLKIPGL